MSMIASLSRRVLQVVSSGFLAFALTLPLGAGQAQAGALSYLWNDYRGGVSQYGVPYYATPINWARNGTKFLMYCYTDNAGQRWAYGQAYNTGQWGYVAMWEVSDQKKVKHC